MNMILEINSWLSGFNHKVFVRIDDNTLRLHFKNRKKTTNVDIHYDKGLDIYHINVFWCRLFFYYYFWIII